MENFVKENPQICTEILNSHITNNIVEHKRTIMHTMQTMGIFDKDTDSDNYLDNEEIVDTPVVNKIIDLTGSETDNPTAMANVQINMINTNDHNYNNISSILSNKFATSKYDISPVHVQLNADEEMNRMSYDADLYDGHRTLHHSSDTVCVKNVHTIPELSELSLQDIN